MALPVSNGMKTRLQKFLAQAGVASRRKSEELILAGLISVNGQVVNKLGTKVDDKKDLVEYKNTAVRLQSVIIYMLNKPVGVLSTVMDEHAKKKVVDYLPTTDRIYPIGRLDKDSEGLILLTNNGELANRLMHPRYEHEKEYVVGIVGSSDGNIKKFKNRFKLDGKITQPMKIGKVCRLSGGYWSVNLILKEGKKRQIRRIAEKLGYQVNKLQRIRIGKLKLGNLNPGKWKIVKETDIL